MGGQGRLEDQWPGRLIFAGGDQLLYSRFIYQPSNENSVKRYRLLFYAITMHNKKIAVAGFASIRLAQLSPIVVAVSSFRPSDIDGGGVDRVALPRQHEIVMKLNQGIRMAGATIAVFAVVSLGLGGTAFMLASAAQDPPPPIPQCVDKIRERIPAPQQDSDPKENSNDCCEHAFLCNWRVTREETETEWSNGSSFVCSDWIRDENPANCLTTGTVQPRECGPNTCNPPPL